jgi:uncharacterized protein (DUF2141 family)
MSRFLVWTCAAFLFGLAAPGVGDETVKKAALTVEVNGFSSQKGSLRLAVFRSPEGWPRDPGKVFRTAVVPVENKVLIVKFEDLAPGTYAVSAYHDENDNGKLDRNFLGIPSEEYGFSNNARAMFGPPDFEEAAFLLPPVEKSIRIRLD